MSVAALVKAEGRAAGLEVSAELAEACATHHRLLVHWNRTHNLTRVTAPEEAARRHYLDCLWPALSVAPEGRADFVDLGSGAGFPGLLIALAWPERAASLVEPAQKRASFLRLAIAELGLSRRVSVSDPPARPAALVVSRATFSRGERKPLADAIAPGGTLWLWSVAAEEPGWPDEAAALGLQALPALSRVLAGETRLILRAAR
jgi:16S rRNA (guanine(527)-N(7))-methyltransferase RsmG